MSCTLVASARFAAAAVLLCAVAARAPGQEEAAVPRLEWKWTEGARFLLHLEDSTRTTTVVRTPQGETKESERERRVADYLLEVEEALEDGAARLRMSYRHLAYTKTGGELSFSYEFRQEAEGAAPVLTAEARHARMPALDQPLATIFRVLAGNVAAVVWKMEVSSTGEVRNATMEGDVWKGLKDVPGITPEVLGELTSMFSGQDAAEGMVHELFARLPEGGDASRPWFVERRIDFAGLSLVGRGSARVESTEGATASLVESLSYKVDATEMAKRIQEQLRRATPDARPVIKMSCPTRPPVRFEGRFDAEAGHQTSWSFRCDDMPLNASIRLRFGTESATVYIRSTVALEGQTTWTRL